MKTEEEKPVKTEEEKPVKTGKTSELYEIADSELTRIRQSCPRCGEGVFLAKHKDRLSCGKCGYTKFQK